MFNKKCTDPFADKVKCADCKHWIDKNDSQKILVISSTWRENDTLEYFCPQHKKNYSTVRKWLYVSVPNEYYKEVQVSEDGIPIGYTKIEDKSKK